jgi:hypothetical protein
MNRTSTATLVISSLVTGLVVVGLTAVTRAGAGGAYAFLFLGLLALGIFLLWPDLRARFFSGRPSGASQSDGSRRRTQARHRAG